LEARWKGNARKRIDQKEKKKAGGHAQIWFMSRSKTKDCDIRRSAARRREGLPPPKGKTRLIEDKDDRAKIRNSGTVGAGMQGQPLRSTVRGENDRVEMGERAGSIPSKGLVGNRRRIFWEGKNHSDIGRGKNLGGRGGAHFKVGVVL